MLEWKDVIQTVGSSLGASAGDCILEFLKVLPEEVTEGRKINLTVSLTYFLGGAKTKSPFNPRLMNDRRMSFLEGHQNF